ncbi:ribonuclease H-like domain-containing protein [Salinarchaeum chitinilyticum]
MRIENSFVPVEGVGPVTERKLWRAGVTEWSEFGGQIVGPTRADRIESFVEEATRRLDRGDAAFFANRVPDAEHWRLFENVREETTFLDIETTGLDRYADRVTTVSIHRDGDTRTLVRGQDLSAERLRAELAESSLLVTFNGRRFDVPFLEASFDLSVDVPHADLMSMCNTLGYSGGLTAVEQTFGIERDRPDISGRDAVRLWHEYERGKDGSLQTLIEYNQEDTVNMRPLMEQACEELHAEVFAAACAETAEDDR